ncbi:hypothetical protein LEMLEM_LOCUS6463 [Lemmus lemmus]
MELVRRMRSPSDVCNPVPVLPQQSTVSAAAICRFVRTHRGEPVPPCRRSESWSLVLLFQSCGQQVWLPLRDPDLGCGYL